MKKINLVIVFLIIGNSVFSQNSNCKVVNNDLTGIYKGGCESGLANGNGVFTFEKGMFMYKGEFLKGKMHGKGEIYSLINNKKQIVSKGTWEDNVFIGNENLKPYDVILTENLDRNLVRKISDIHSRVFFNFFQNGTRNNINNLSIVLSSGNSLSGSNIFAYENVEFPLKCQVTYKTKSKFSATSYDVRFELLINEPGEWEILLHN